MSIQRDGGSVTVSVGARIDTYQAPQFAAEMEQAVAGATELVLDFSKLTYISSSGLRAVILAVKAMDRQGIMRIVNVREPIYEILETTGFTGMCEVEQTR